MHSLRFLLFASLFLCLILFGAAGCRSPRAEDVVRSTLHFQSGTNVIDVSHPKDTKIRRLRYSPTTQEVEVEGYESMANAAAVEATVKQAESQARIVESAMGFGRDLLARGAAAYGLPVPQPSAPPAAMVGPTNAPAGANGTNVFRGISQP